MKEPVLDPQLVEAWIKGSLRIISIGPLDMSEALALRHRLYRERLKMRSAANPNYEAAARTSIKIRPIEHTAQVNVILHPSNMLIAKALKRAGITDNDPPELD